MYRTRQIRIKKDHYFYPYCADICQASARLYNRGTYLVRQYATAVDRLEAKKELTPNQKEAYEQIREPIISVPLPITLEHSLFWSKAEW